VETGFYHWHGLFSKKIWNFASPDLEMKIATLVLTIEVKFRRAFNCTANLVSRLIDAVPRNDAAPGSVTAFAPHITR